MSSLLALLGPHNASPENRPLQLPTHHYLPTYPHVPTVCHFAVALVVTRCLGRGTGVHVGDLEGLR